MIVDFKTKYNPQSTFCCHIKHISVEYHNFPLNDGTYVSNKCSVCDYHIGLREGYISYIITHLGRGAVSIVDGGFGLEAISAGLRLNPKIIPNKIDTTTISEHIKSRMILR